MTQKELIRRKTIQPTNLVLKLKWYIFLAESFKIFLNCNRVFITVWLHYLNSDETLFCLLGL